MAEAAGTPPRPPPVGAVGKPPRPLPTPGHASAAAAALESPPGSARRAEAELREFLTALAVGEQIRDSANVVPRPDNPAVAVLAKDQISAQAAKLQRELPPEQLQAALKIWRELCPQEAMHERIMRSVEDFAGPATVRKLSEISQSLRSSMRAGPLTAPLAGPASEAAQAAANAAGAAAGRAAEVAAVWVSQFESWLGSQTGEHFLSNLKTTAVSLGTGHDLPGVLDKLKATIVGTAVEGGAGLRQRFLAANPSLVSEYQTALEEFLARIHEAIGEASPDLKALIDEATAGLAETEAGQSRDMVSFLLVLIESPEKRAALLRQLMLLAGRFLMGAVRLARIPCVTGDYIDWTGTYDWDLREIALTEIHIPMQCAQLIVRPNAISVQFTNVRLRSENVHWLVRRRTFPAMTFRGDVDADIIIRRLALPVAVGIKGDVPCFEVEKRPLIFGPMDLKFSRSRISWVLNQFSRVLSEGMIEETEKLWNEEIAKVSAAIVAVVEDVVRQHWPGAPAPGPSPPRKTPARPPAAGPSPRAGRPGAYTEAAVQTDPEPPQPAAGHGGRPRAASALEDHGPNGRGSPHPLAAGRAFLADDNTI